MSGLNNIYNLGEKDQGVNYGYQTNLINQLSTPNNSDSNKNNFGLRNSNSGDDFQNSYEGQM